MKPSEALMNNFYQNLGQLFYSVAAADNSIQQKETEKLKEIVRKEWLQMDETEDNFGSDSAFQIETVFDWLQERQPRSEDAFKKFSEFYLSHDSLFTAPYKNLIAKTAGEIAGAFHGNNKAELVVLNQLNSLFHGK